MITFARKGRWEGDAGMKQLLSEALRGVVVEVGELFRRKNCGLFFCGGRVWKKDEKRWCNISIIIEGSLEV